MMRWACIAVLFHASIAAAQLADLGHRLPGSVGLDAGTQPEPGLYVADRVLWFASDRANDRAGNALPIENLDIDAVANAIGVSGTLKLDGVYINGAFAVPYVNLSLSSDAPEASLDRLDLGNVYVEPIKAGIRWPHVDAVAGYSFYIPTDEGARSGIGRPQWSHQFSLGGTGFLDERRGWRVSALASYVLNGKKLGVDVTRGDSIQIAGGVGGRVLEIVDVGVIGYALWQVTDDRGSAVPPQLVGARDRVFGVGPEVDVALPALRSRLTARLSWDLGGETRPVGTLLLVGIAVVAAR
jgi:hypothetical protein